MQQSEAELKDTEDGWERVTKKSRNASRTWDQQAEDDDQHNSFNALDATQQEQPTTKEVKPAVQREPRTFTVPEDELTPSQRRNMRRAQHREKEKEIARQKAEEEKKKLEEEEKKKQEAKREKRRRRTEKAKIKKAAERQELRSKEAEAETKKKEEENKRRADEARQKREEEKKRKQEEDKRKEAEERMKQEEERKKKEERQEMLEAQRQQEKERREKVRQEQLRLKALADERKRQEKEQREKEGRTLLGLDNLTHAQKRCMRRKRMREQKRVAEGRPLPEPAKPKTLVVTPKQDPVAYHEPVSEEEQEEEEKDWEAQVEEEEIPQPAPRQPSPTRNPWTNIKAVNSFHHHPPATVQIPVGEKGKEKEKEYTQALQLYDMPEEILLAIVVYLPAFDLLSFALTCSRMHRYNLKHLLPR